MSGNIVGRVGAGEGDSPRRRARALGDEGLVAAMRTSDPWAWSEFIERFEGPLRRVAARMGIPEPEREECVLETLEEEGLRLARLSLAPPRTLVHYLTRALRSRYLTRRRAAQRRDLRYRLAADHGDVVRSVASSAALRERGDGGDDGTDAAANESPATRGVGRLVGILRRQMSEEEQAILVWFAEQVPLRTIAEWLGVSYDAAKKRVWRLCTRLRVLAEASLGDLEEPERRELARLFGRARGAVSTDGMTTHSTRPSGTAPPGAVRTSRDETKETPT